MQKIGKDRLFEVLSRLDKTFKLINEEQLHHYNDANETFAPDQNGNEVTDTVSPATSTAPLNEDQSESPIHKYVYFAFNYPNDFIEQTWADDENLMTHLKSKFQGYYNKYGSASVMNYFYTELDVQNQRKLDDWIINNYNG